jgi:sulfur-carrier protein
VTWVRFTKNLQRHVACPPVDVAYSPEHTVATVLADYFAQVPGVQHYVLDDQGAPRKHIAVFVGDHTVTDRVRLSDPVGPTDEIYVMQALSGG